MNFRFKFTFEPRKVHFHTYATIIPLSRSIRVAFSEKNYIIFGKIKENQLKNRFSSEKALFFSCSSGAVESKLTQVWEEKAVVRVDDDRANRMEKKKNYNSQAGKTSLDHMASVRNNSENVITFPPIPPRPSHRIEGKTQNCITSPTLLCFHLRWCTCVRSLAECLKILLFMGKKHVAAVLKVNKPSF